MRSSCAILPIELMRATVRVTSPALIMPRPAQAVLFRLLVAVGTALGRYRGNDWPGCPSRCPGALMCAEESAN
jgi:hypothetical protein